MSAGAGWTGAGRRWPRPWRVGPARGTRFVGALPSSTIASAALQSTQYMHSGLHIPPGYPQHPLSGFGTIDIPAPSASKALRQWPAHVTPGHAPPTPGRTSHVACGTWAALSRTGTRAVCFHARDSHGLNSAVPPLLRLPAQCPWTALRPPLVVRPCSSPMHVIQGSSELIRGISRGMASIADRMASRPRGSPPAL